MTADGAADPTDDVTLTGPELVDLVAAALQAAGAGRVSAQATAQALVQAEIDGQSGHGLSRVESYVAQLRTGKVDGAATPQVTRPRPGVISVDAANGFFYPAFDAAVGPVVEAARANGIAAAGFTRSHHAGALGLAVERLATEGLVALMFANTPTAMTAWGGRTPLFGTNPIAFAAPAPNAPPIVVDLALSKVARGKILTASKRGEPIPKGWAKDADGNPTTDAAAAMAGTLEPIGGAKGAALALMVEVLAAAVLGANLSSEATSFFDGEGEPPGVGQLLIVIDPAAFGGPAVAEKIGYLIEAIASDAGARVPGSTKTTRRMAAERNGIPVSPSVLAGLRAMAGSPG